MGTFHSTLCSHFCSFSFRLKNHLNAGQSFHVISARELCFYTAHYVVLYLTLLTFSCLQNAAADTATLLLASLFYFN